MAYGVELRFLETGYENLPDKGIIGADNRSGLMKVTAWNVDRYDPSGVGYGLRFSRADRDRHLRREWGLIRLKLDEPQAWAQANIDKPSFWDDDLVIIDQTIGQWLLRKGYARWKPHHPPVFELVHLQDNEFEIVPHLLPEGLPCHHRVNLDEWQLFQKAILEGTKMQVERTIRQRCQDLITRLKNHFRDPATGLISCAVCRWSKPAQGFTGDIIEMHHHDPIAAAPDQGRVITWEEAKNLFSPLCPRCHALAHAHPERGQCYGTAELRALVQL